MIGFRVRRHGGRARATLLFLDRFVGLLWSVVVIKSCQQMEINEDSSFCRPHAFPPLTVVPAAPPLRSTALEGTERRPGEALPVLIMAVVQGWDQENCRRVSLATAHPL